MSDCLFCGIIAGEIPSEKVLETEAVVAFRDIQPAAPVHVLLVPRLHIKDATTVGPSEGGVLTDLFAAARTVAEAEGIAESGYRLIFNIGPDAGQSVFHLHMHLVGGKNLGGVAR